MIAELEDLVGTLSGVPDFVVNEMRKKITSKVDKELFDVAVEMAKELSRSPFGAPMQPKVPHKPGNTSKPALPTDPKQMEFL